MLTISNQKYLLSLANLYSTDAIKAIRHNQILDDEYDKPQCIDVIMDNDFEKYSQLDTLVREELMQELKTTFNYLDYDELTELSDIVLNYQSYLSSMISALPANLHEPLQKEIKHLGTVNSKLCNMMGNVDPTK